MDTQAIAVDAIELTFPAFLTQIESLPDTPDGTVTLAVQKGETAGLALAFPVEPGSAMMQDEAALIARIHELLEDNQGVVEVRGGSSAGRSFIYSITKTLAFSDEGEPQATQYTLALDVSAEGSTAHIQAYFEEAAAFGHRDMAVFSRRVEELGDIDSALEGWSVDPYDPSRDSGILMTLAEHPEYDSEFPEHALSMLRQLVSCLLGE